MSKREDIAGNIVTAISTGTSPITLKKVTREPFNVDELSEQQYPACFVQSGNEVRSDETMTSSTITRQATADYVIIGYVKGTPTNIDTKRNELITTIETRLNSDRTRGGFAKQTQVVEVSTDEGVLFPIGGIRMVVRVMYQYTSGTP
jgi:argininosuccinate synthase